jgi:hypothetical protein
MGPDVDRFAIDVSYAALRHKAEVLYLNRRPTSSVLPDKAVGGLRAAAGTIIVASPEFQRLLNEVGATIVPEPSPAGSATSPVQRALPVAVPAARQRACVFLGFSEGGQSNEIAKCLDAGIDCGADFPGIRTAIRLSREGAVAAAAEE